MLGYAEKEGSSRRAVCVYYSKPTTPSVISGGLSFPQFPAKAVQNVYHFVKSWVFLGNQRTWECSRTLARCVRIGIFQQSPPRWVGSHCPPGKQWSLSPSHLWQPGAGPARCYQWGQGHTRSLPHSSLRSSRKQWKADQVVNRFKRFKELSEETVQVPCC